MKQLKLAFAGLLASSAAAPDAFAQRPPGLPLGGGLPAPPWPINHVGREGRSGAGMMGRMPWWAWVWPLLAWGVLVAIFMGGVGGAVVVAAEAVVLEQFLGQFDTGYPQWRNQPLASWRVIVSRAGAICSSIAAIERGSAARSSVLSLDQHGSIGDRSGE